MTQSSPGTVQSSNPDNKITTRRVDFGPSFETVPKHFAADGDLIGSHLNAVLSSVFPDGEDYFVRSVRNFRDQITDPALKKQVAGFIGQESVHGREHRAFNERLAELGYPTKRLERLNRRGLALRERLTSPKSNLAVTAALEHFTATLAELMLSDPEAREGLGNEEVRNLFVWHALEESEHKAVAFDVYKAVGGSERMRVVTMNVLRYSFVVFLAVTVTLWLLRDPATYRRGNLRRSLKRLRNSPLAGRRVWDQLRDYNRPDFHPNDSDTTELVARWRAELFGQEGTMTDKLPGASAA